MPRNSNSSSNSRYWYHRTITTLGVLLLALPIAATLLYSLSTRWGATVLPDGLTLHWYADLLSDPRFLWSFARSVFVCAAGLALCIAVLIPVIFIVFYSLPGLKKVFNFIVVLPFAVPPVVSSVGLLQLYSDGFLPISGTFWILIFTYFTLVIPFVYRSLANSFAAVNLHDLVDAAKLLGASPPQAFVLCVLPNLKKGLLSAIFISFSILIGEFVFANILVGTRFETLQIYLYNTRQISGHFTSALVIFYFAFIFLLTVLASRIGKAK